MSRSHKTKKMLFFLYLSLLLISRWIFLLLGLEHQHTLPHLSPSTEQMGRQTRAAGWEQQANDCIHQKEHWLPVCRFISARQWQKEPKTPSKFPREGISSLGKVSGWNIYIGVGGSEQKKTALFSSQNKAFLARKIKKKRNKLNKCLKMCFEKLN